MRIFIVLALFISTIAVAQNEPPEYQSTEVAPGIEMVTGANGFVGGNMAILVGEDYVAMIDDGLAPIAPDLLAYATNSAGRSINFMINTHVHADHTGGNAHFAEKGTVIFAHENIRKRLLQDSTPAGGDGGLPVVTFADGVTFHLNGLEARVIHSPSAHTDGDAFIHFPGVNVIHAGDLLFHNLFPYIDLGNGGSVDGYIAAQQTILDLADETTKIIPGHGELTDKAGMQGDLDFLRSAQRQVRELVAEGLTEDEILERDPLAEFSAVRNWNFITTERMTRTLVQDLVAE